MATDKSPWGELGVSNPMAAILKITSSKERPSFPKGFSKEGVEFLSKCLVRNPKGRSTVDELLKHPFIVSREREKQGAEYVEMYSPLSVLDNGLSDEGEEELEEMKVVRSKIP